MVPSRDRHPPGGQPRRGRPLDPRRHETILDAALSGLSELGYDRLSMEEIATRAGVGKGALYRRWSSKAELIVEAMVRWRERIAPIVVPDTGSLLGDLRAMAQLVPDFDDAARRQLAVLTGLVGAATHDAALREALTENGLSRPRQVIGTVLEQARERGEIRAEVDLELVPEIVIGINFVRMMLGEIPSRELVERVLIGIIYPLVTGAMADY